MAIMIRYPAAIAVHLINYSITDNLEAAAFVISKWRGLYMHKSVVLLWYLHSLVNYWFDETLSIGSNTGSMFTDKKNKNP